MADNLDEHAQYVRSAKRDHRGRVEVFEIVTSKLMLKLPVDALEGLRAGIFKRPESAQVETQTTGSTPTVQERIQAGAKRT